MRHQLADPINGEVHEALRDKFTCQMNEQVSSAVNAQIRQYIRRQLPERRTHETFSDFRRAAYARNMQVIEQIHEQIHENVRNMFRSLRAWTFRDDFGQFDMLLARYDFLGRLGIDVSKLVPSFDLAKSCGAAALFWDWAFIGAKPEYIHCNEQGRIHCETGPAIRYYDGFSIFAIHGVRVPEKVVVSPDTITVAEINLETNVEMRRVMLERYGVERYLMDSGAVEIHRDDFGILYRQQLPRDEPLVMVKVVNATPEPDGSFKDYFLRVPPTMERAIQAVAWTFGKEENDYTPELQT